MSDAKLRTLTLEALRALIQRQLDARRECEQRIKEYDDLLRESLGEFMRRVADADKKQ